MMNYVNELTTPGNQDEIISVGSTTPDPVHTMVSAVAPEVGTAVVVHNHQGDQTGQW